MIVAEHDDDLTIMLDELGTLKVDRHRDGAMMPLDGWSARRFLDDAAAQTVMAGTIP